MITTTDGPSLVVGPPAAGSRWAAQSPITELPDYAILLVRMGAVVVIAFAASWLVRRVIHRWEVRVGGEDVDVTKSGEAKRAQTLGQTLRAATTVTVWFLAGLVALSMAGIDIAPLVAAAGVGGVALGFGAQSLVKDFIGGFFVLSENQFDVGDVVKVADVSGVVERMTLRATVLRGLDGARHVVPNGEIRVSSNLTKGFSRYLIDLPVPYEEDVDRVVEIVREVAADMRREPEFAGAMLSDLEILGVDEYGDAQVLLKVYVETIPGKQWAVGRELRARIKTAYDRAGISIPYGHREVIVRHVDGRPEEDAKARQTRSGEDG